MHAVVQDAVGEVGIFFGISFCVCCFCCCCCWSSGVGASGRWSSVVGASGLLVFLCLFVCLPSVVCVLSLCFVCLCLSVQSFNPLTEKSCSTAALAVSAPGAFPSLKSSDRQCWDERRVAGITEPTLRLMKCSGRNVAHSDGRLALSRRRF